MGLLKASKWDIAQALHLTLGNMRHAAQMLGVHPSTIRRRVRSDLWLFQQRVAAVSGQGVLDIPTVAASLPPWSGLKIEYVTSREKGPWVCRIRIGGSAYNTADDTMLMALRGSLSKAGLLPL